MRRSFPARSVKKKKMSWFSSHTAQVATSNIFGRPVYVLHYPSNPLATLLRLPPNALKIEERRGRWIKSACALPCRVKPYPKSHESLDTHQSSYDGREKKDVAHQARRRCVAFVAYSSNYGSMNCHLPHTYPKQGCCCLSR